MDCIHCFMFRSRTRVVTKYMVSEILRNLVRLVCSQTNFCLHDKKTVNGLKKIAWTSLFRLKRQHIYSIHIYSYTHIYIYICIHIYRVRKLNPSYWKFFSIYIYIYIFYILYKENKRTFSATENGSLFALAANDKR